MYQKTKKKSTSGITLVELLMAMALFSVIIAVTISMFTLSLDVWGSGRSRFDITQDGNLALERIVRYLELASNITAATETEITFDADVYNDGTDDTITITFDAVTKKLNQTIDGVTMTLAPYVQDFTFSYYQSDTETPFTPLIQDDRDTICVIMLSLTMNRGSETITLGSSAYCRNQGVV